MNSRPWQVLHVLSNHEKRVVRHLEVRSIENYLPVFKERVKWTDRNMIVERPLFSGYVFVRSSPTERVPIISISGVLRFLGDEERNTIGAIELERIREGLASGLTLRPHPCVSLGTRVQVRDGVFAGVEGMVTELRQECKVILSIGAVNQCFSLEVELRNLAILKKPVSSERILPRPAYGNLSATRLAGI